MELLKLEKTEMESSSEDWLIDQHLCRCCHSEGKFQSLSSTGLLMEDKLLYLDALRFCLDIEFIPVERPLSDVVCYICEDCVVRLYEACSFRKQVLNCEERFQTLYIHNRIKVANSESIKNEIKEELQEQEDVKFEDNHDGDIINLTDIDEVSEESEKNTQKKTKRRRVAKKPPPDKSLQDKDTPTKKKKKAIPDTEYVRIGDRFKCLRCQKTFSTYKYTSKHFKFVHNRDYNCKICNASFLTKAPLMQHKLELHDIDERLKCNACDSSFYTKSGLFAHRNSFHMLGVKRKCPQCDFETCNYNAMERHKIKHKTVKDYHCKFCKKSFIRRPTLKLHERIHTGDRRKVCAECGQAFVQKASLNYHMMKHHPEVKA